MRRALLAALALAACAPALPEVTRADAERSGRDFETLTAGRRLYADKCGGCHRLFAPGSRTLAEWDAELVEMRDRAHLTPAQSETLRTWLSAFAANGTPGRDAP